MANPAGTAWAILAAALLATPGAVVEAREPQFSTGPIDLGRPPASTDQPFTVELVPGMSVTRREPGPDFDIYDIVAIDAAFVSVYAGCCANFPIHEGAKVQNRPGGLKVAVLNGRVVEYLWSRPTWPLQLHVWAHLDPTIDADTVDRVAASVRPK